MCPPLMQFGCDVIVGYAGRNQLWWGEHACGRRNNRRKIGRHKHNPGTVLPVVEYTVQYCVAYSPELPAVNLCCLVVFYYIAFIHSKIEHSILIRNSYEFVNLWSYIV